MKNSIYIRQNEETILKLLFLQRQLYDRANILRYFSWILAIAVPLIIELLSKFSCLTIYVKLTAVILIVLHHIFDHIKKMNIETSAITKEYIDSKIFDMTIGTGSLEMSFQKIREKAEIEIANNREKYIYQISNNGMGNPPGVKDWYATHESSTHFENVFKCQKENIWWDQKITKIYKMCLLLCLIISLFAVSIIVKNWELSEIFDYILKFEILLTIVFIEINKIYKYSTLSNRIDGVVEVIESNALYNEISINILQKLIFQRRGNGLNPPDIIHRINSINFHDLWKNSSND